MPLRWDPFNEVLDLAAGMMGEVAEPPPSVFSPPVDVFETDDALYIRAEVPGVSPEEIRVEVQGRRLVIAGDRGQADSTRRYHHLERFAGPFERRFNLSPELASDRIEAHYCDGVLEVRLPKNEAKRSKQIEIKSR